MRTQELSMILEAIKSGNPKNLYINNGGLAQLGEHLFYPKKGREEQQKELINILKNSFPETYGTFLESLKKYHLTSYYTPKSIVEYKISLLIWSIKTRPFLIWSFRIFPLEIYRLKMLLNMIILQIPFLRTLVITSIYMHRKCARWVE